MNQLCMHNGPRAATRVKCISVLVYSSDMKRLMQYKFNATYTRVSYPIIWTCVNSMLTGESSRYIEHM